MNAILQTLKTFTENAKDSASSGRDFEAYCQAAMAENFIDAMVTLEELAFKSDYSQVDINLYCSGSQNSDNVDYEVEGANEWGDKEDIVSDLGFDSIVQAIIEIAISVRERR